MRFTFGDAMAAAFESAGSYRWAEYQPFFVILLVELVFLALTTQLGYPWAMGLVAPVTRLAGGEESLHYPALFTFLPILLAWVESALFAFPGCVLIPLALLRICARTDRALSLGARAGRRFTGAILPTLIAILLGIGANWGWQSSLAPRMGAYVMRSVQGDLGVFIVWALTLLGGYAILSLLLYVPVAAVQARATLFSSLGYGIRFGLAALVPTLLFAFVFAVPANAVQYFVLQQSSNLIARLRPEIVVVLLGLYAFFSSMATYFTYGAAVRLYRSGRGSD
jgi:hypothetical protein